MIAPLCGDLYSLGRCISYSIEVFFQESSEERSAPFPFLDESSNFLDDIVPGIQEDTMEPDRKGIPLFPHREHAGGVIGDSQGDSTGCDPLKIVPEGDWSVREGQLKLFRALSGQLLKPLHYLVYPGKIQGVHAFGECHPEELFCGASGKKRPF